MEKFAITVTINVQFRVDKQKAREDYVTGLRHNESTNRLWKTIKAVDGRGLEQSHVVMKNGKEITSLETANTIAKKLAKQAPKSSDHTNRRTLRWINGFSRVNVPVFSNGDVENAYEATIKEVRRQLKANESAHS